MTRIAGIPPEVARELLAFYRQAKASGLLRPSNTRQEQLPQAVPIYVSNASGEAIPPYACMQATGTVEFGGQNYVSVSKPADATGEAGGFLFNSPSQIEIGGKGIASAGPITKALGTGATATAGAKWSPSASSWSIGPATNGLFTMAGNDDVSSNVVRVFVTPGAECTPTTYITQMQNSGTALQYKSFNTTTCEESAWTDLIELTSDCPAT